MGDPRERVVDTEDLRAAAERVSRILPLRSPRATSLDQFGDDLSDDIGELSKRWPRDHVSFSLPALREFLEGIMDLSLDVSEMGFEMADDPRNVFVAPEILSRVQENESVRQDQLMPLYRELVLDKMDDADDRGVPYEDVVVESPDVRDAVFSVLTMASGTIAALTHIEDIRPDILDLPGIESVIGGLELTGKVAVAMHEAAGRVIETADDMITWTGRIADAIVWGSKLALAGGAVYLVYWALRDDEEQEKSR